MTTKKKKQTRSGIVHHAKHLLVPHKGNNYRPHLIRWQGLAVIVGLSLLLQVAYGFVTTGQFAVLGRSSDISVSELVADTNVERQRAGLTSLRVNDSLNQAAFLKAKDMLANNYWAHESPTGVTPWHWLSEVGYGYDVAGENLAKNYPNAQATVDAWMASPTHRANILSDQYQDVGFAIADGTLNGRQATLIVAYYGKASASTAVAAANDNRAVYSPPVAGTVGNPLAYFGSAIQSLSPVTVGILGLLVIVGIVGLVAHHYRYKLPKSWRQSWRLHHGLYTMVGVGLLAVLIIYATGGGQI